MPHIDTLKVFEEYKAAGLDEKTAKEFTNILENSFMTKIGEWIKELKVEAVSQKTTCVLGFLILSASLILMAMLWNLSKDLKALKNCVIAQRANK